MFLRFSRLVISFICIFSLFSCKDIRIKEKPEFKQVFEKQGIKDGCFILRDHNHETIYYWDRARCLQQFSPASTFKVFNSLVALETNVAPDEALIVKWDGISRSPEWDKDMNMREAFKVSCVPYYREIARRIGPATMKQYLDTVKYGNMQMGKTVDSFWLDGSLKISADEQVGVMKRLYFDELKPFSDRSQRIVRSMMLQEDTKNYKLYYKTGWSELPGKSTLWVVGFAETIAQVKEQKESMNKSSVRITPYFFAMNFDIAGNDTSRDWVKIRLDALHGMLAAAGVR